MSRYPAFGQMECAAAPAAAACACPAASFRIMMTDAAAGAVSIFVLADEAIRLALRVCLLPLVGRLSGLARCSALTRRAS